MKLTPDIIASIMSEEKANQKSTLKIPLENIRKYFPKKYTPEQIADEIMRMLEDMYNQK